MRETLSATDISSAAGDGGPIYRYAFGTNGLTGAAEPAWIWAGYALADQRGRKNLESLPEMTDAARRVLLGEDDGFALRYGDGWLTGAMPDFRHRAYGDENETGRRRFAFCDTLLITARRQPLQSVDDVRRQIERDGRGFASPQAAFEAIALRSLAQVGSEFRQVATRLDTIEDRVVGDSWLEVREPLSELRRRVVARQRMLNNLLGVFSSIESDGDDKPPETIIDLADSLSAKTQTLIHDCEQAQARARLLQDEVMARLGERSNRLLHLLSVLTAVMMPATIVSGLFGMNVGGLPFAANASGFLMASSAAGAASAITYFIVRHFGRR